MEQDTPKKFQVQERPTKRISVNDALTQDVFSMTAEEFQKLMDGDERKFLEAKTKKHGVITSSYWLKCLDDERIKISKPLDESDRNILDACISAQQAGYEIITLRGIWRSITGNLNANMTLTPALRKEILERIDRLACLRLTVDISNACSKKIYADDTKYKARVTLLPCDIIEAEINGQLCDAVIKFNGESPLIKIARARSGKKGAAQILTYPVKLLNVPNQRDTPTTTAIKNYIVRRIETAKLHTNMKRTILFSTLLERCGLSDADRKKRYKILHIIEEIMKSLVEKEEIKSFEIVKLQGALTKIIFTFP